MPTTREVSCRSPISRLVLEALRLGAKRLARLSVARHLVLRAFDVCGRAAGHDHISQTVQLALAIVEGE